MPKDDPELLGAQLADALKLIMPGLATYAKLSRQYFMELKEQDFDDKDALYLTSKFVESIIFGKSK